MKSQFFPLLKYEIMRFTWLIPLVYGFFALDIYHTEIDRTKYMFSLNGSGQETSIVMMLWFGFYAFFFTNGRPTAGQKSGSPATWGVVGLDFFFSRAIDRCAWFVIKTSLFALIAIIPAVVLCVSHPKSTVIRIELPYNSTATRSTMTAFYHENFDGAHLEKSDTGHNEDYLILPNGRQDMMHFQIVSSILVLTIFQLLAFLFWPRGWGLLGAFIGGFGTMIFLSFPSAHVPSHYEEGVAFVAQHLDATIGALAIFYLICQFYCGWRFIRTEFAS